MSMIRLHIGNSDIIYGQDLVYSSAQIAKTIASNNTKTRLAKTALGIGDLGPGPSNEHFLKNYGSEYVNSLILSNVLRPTALATTGPSQIYENVAIELVDVVVDVKKQFEIKSTALVGRNGTVKEYIQQKDYTIKVVGNLYSNYPNTFPYHQLRFLEEWLHNERSVFIANQFINSFGIKKVILSEASFDQSKMIHFNVMPFSLTFSSDEDYDFLVQQS